MNNFKFYLARLQNQQRLDRDKRWAFFAWFCWQMKKKSCLTWATARGSRHVVDAAAKKFWRRISGLLLFPQPPSRRMLSHHRGQQWSLFFCAWKDSVPSFFEIQVSHVATTFDIKSGTWRIIYGAIVGNIVVVQYLLGIALLLYHLCAWLFSEVEMPALCPPSKISEIREKG